MEAESVNPEEIVRNNSAEYQQHLTTRNRIKKALEHQNKIRIFQTIPKRHLPPTTLEIIPPDTNLSKELQEEYQQLFFRQLNRVITHNTISLELENARLREITEHQLTTSNAPTAVVQLQFYIQNIPTQQHSYLTAEQQHTETETAETSLAMEPTPHSPITQKGENAK